MSKTTLSGVFGLGLESENMSLNSDFPDEKKQLKLPLMLQNIPNQHLLFFNRVEKYYDTVHSMAKSGHTIV